MEPRNLAENHDRPAGRPLTRREMLVRSAAAGGAILAAQSLGAVTAFAQTSPPPPGPTEPPPPEPTPPPTGKLPSNFQVVVGFDGGTYGVKYDTGGWDRIGRGTACDFTTSYDHPPSALLSALSAPGVVATGRDEGNHLAYVLALPAGITFVEGRAKDGTCQATPGASDKCGAPVTALPDGTYAFSAC